MKLIVLKNIWLKLKNKLFVSIWLGILSGIPITSMLLTLLSTLFMLNYLKNPKAKVEIHLLKSVRIDGYYNLIVSLNGTCLDAGSFVSWWTQLFFV